MKLVRLARARWDVLATLADDGELCDVLDFLLEKRYGQQATRRSLFAFLRCVTGFLKTDKTPSRKLSEAVELRRRYFEDRRRGNIEIIELDEEPPR